MISATVTGNLGRDAEMREVTGPARRDTVCSFSVGSSAGRDKPTTWVRCSLWGRRGASLERYLTKGSKVAVSGELSTREHNGKTYLELRVSDLDLMGGGERQRAPAAEDAMADRVDGGAGDDDLPF